MNTSNIIKQSEWFSVNSKPIEETLSFLEKLHLTPNGALIGLGILTVGSVVIYSIQCGCSINGDLSYKDASIKFEIKKDENLSGVKSC